MTSDTSLYSLFYVESKNVKICRVFEKYTAKIRDMIPYSKIFKKFPINIGPQMNSFRDKGCEYKGYHIFKLLKRHCFFTK